MALDLASTFDFKEQAKALLKRLGAGSGSAPNPTLALLAVETALREAFAHGQGTARVARVAARSADVSRPASQPGQRTPPTRPAEPAPAECAHEWEEVFLDGRALGIKCADCGILQRDVQDRCDHYFVDVGGSQVCVACRKAKRAGR